MGFTSEESGVWPQVNLVLFRQFKGTVRNFKELLSKMTMPDSQQYLYMINNFLKNIVSLGLKMLNSDYYCFQQLVEMFGIFNNSVFKIQSYQHCYQIHTRIR